MRVREVYEAYSEGWEVPLQHEEKAFPISKVEVRRDQQLRRQVALRLSRLYRPNRLHGRNEGKESTGRKESIYQL